MKKMLLAALCLCLFLSACTMPAQKSTTDTTPAQEDTTNEVPVQESSIYATEWDLTQIYADQAAFDAEYAAAEALLPQFEDLQGSISTPEGMLAYLDLKKEFNPYMQRLSNYASFRASLDVSDADAKNLNARVSQLQMKLDQATSFIDSELAAMTATERALLADAPELADYAHTLDYLKDEKKIYHSAETNHALATLNDALFTTDEVFKTLLYSDLPKVTYTMEDGEEIVLDKSTINKQANNGTDRDTLIEMEKLLAKRFQSFEKTFAACLDAHVRTSYDKALLDNYDSTLEYMLDKEHIDPKVYTMLIETAHSATPEYQRYYRTMKHALGLDDTEMYRFDTSRSATNFVPKKTFDESAADVIDALSIFGEDYVDVIDQMLKTGHVDAFPADNKNTGGFSSDVDGIILPYILMNYKSADNISTLAHELGHSLYSYISAVNQPPQYAAPSIFTQEVTSITNEFIFYRTMYDKAETDDERLYYLQKQIGIFTNVFFTQMLYAEFEDYCYKTVEAGEKLSAAALNEKYASLSEMYQGDVLASPDGSENHWCGVPHFNYNYYVYKYASSVCYASATASRIYSGEEGAEEAYMKFMKLGASVDPMDALAVAGIDPLAQSTYDTAMEYFTELVDEYATLTSTR